VPLSPNATIDRALARAVVAEGLWAAAGETGLFGDVLAPLAERHLRPVAGVAAETRRIIAPGFCAGEGAIELAAGELIGDVVDAVADACPAA
jgi:hypothetical protein